MCNETVLEYHQVKFCTVLPNPKKNTQVSYIIYYLLTESEVINVLTSLSLGQYIKASVWDFPVMTERTRLISYLLYGLSSAILKNNTIKTPQWLSSSLTLKKDLYASFSFSYTLSIFFVAFVHALVAFTHKSNREKFS